MILIYSHTDPPRLHYICEFIFKEVLQSGYRITVEESEFRNFDGIKINYSNKDIPGYKISSTGLLFEKSIEPQNVSCFIANGRKAFFRTTDSDFPFDIFAASFYLLSRYEEYLPHTKDIYGRFAHENALAFKENFLDQPLINTWIQDLIESLQEVYTAFNPTLLPFRFLPTYDIDIAYSYKHKSLIRNIAGFIRSPSSERIKVLSGKEHDPYDNYSFMDELHVKYHLNPVYFFLVPKKKGKYDKNLSVENPAITDLIKRHSNKYNIGLHPSWISNEQNDLLQKEKESLEYISGKQIVQSRQHYIRFEMPETFRNLIRAGIKKDYSMGYGSINGFRASVASSFLWYDLKAEEKTELRLQPFCFMDANSHYEQHQSSDESFDELIQYYHECKKVNGELVTIFHNNFLGSAKEFSGWKEMYQKFVSNILAKR